MIAHLDSLRGRAFILILGLLLASNAAAVWIYGQRHDDAMNALHDVMVAEQAAVLIQLMDRLPVEQRRSAAEALSSAMIQVRIGNDGRSPTGKKIDRTRTARIRNVINALLPALGPDRVHVFFSTRGAPAEWPGLNGVDRPAREGKEKTPFREAELEDASVHGRIEVATKLSDGTKLTVASSVVSVPHFTWSQLLPSLLALTASALLIAFWLLSRLTAPLGLLKDAARRLAADINAPAIREAGPSEVRSATAAFNALQTRVRQLIADQAATAAAIAHDLGTPVTRMRLRAHEVQDDEVRQKLLSDVDQMQRMIAGALDFTRLDFATEQHEKVDIVSIAESVCSDLADLGKSASFTAASPITLKTKPILLRRAIMNIAQNATDHGTAAHIVVTKDRGTVSITVFDEGAGMDEKDWNEAGKPFHRLRRASDKPKGSGLGLTIAHRIVENLGGRLNRIDNDAGRFGVSMSFMA